MRNLTVRIFNKFFNYDNTHSIGFHHGTDNRDRKVFWMKVWDTNGKYDEINLSEEQWTYAKEKLEEGLINGYVYIDLNKKGEW